MRTTAAVVATALATALVAACSDDTDLPAPAASASSQPSTPTTAPDSQPEDPRRVACAGACRAEPADPGTIRTENVLRPFRASDGQLPPELGRAPSNPDASEPSSSSASNAAAGRQLVPLTAPPQRVYGAASSAACADVDAECEVGPHAAQQQAPL